MRIAKEVSPDIRVAPLTSLAADVSCVGVKSQRNRSQKQIANHCPEYKRGPAIEDAQAGRVL
jgi:hypothetical protein